MQVIFLLMHVANRRRGLENQNVETALISDLEVLTLGSTEGYTTRNPRTTRDPTMYLEAMEGDEAQKWKNATHAKWGSVLENNTFQTFNELDTASYLDQRSKLEGSHPTPLQAPVGVKTISSKWVYKKINPDGTIRYKVRLVIRGFEQTAGMHMGETYAPVSKLTTFRLLMSLAARHGWKVDHMGVATAFLNPKVDCDAIYMTLPLGMEWVDPGLHNAGVWIVRLRKALYGLHQAPKLWFDTINNFLIELGFKASSADCNLFIKGSVILLLYVDDIIIIDSDKEGIRGTEVKDLLSTKYKMTSLGIARRFLGINIEINERGISLYQGRYIDAILQRFRMEAAHDAKSPMDPNICLDNTNCKDKTANKDLYLSIVGSLIYAALATRPNISFCVTTLSRYNHAPLQMHLTAAKRVLRYLKHTCSLQLHYSRESAGSLMGFTDSDWVGRIADRKSVGGCIFFGSCDKEGSPSGPIL